MKVTVITGSWARRYVPQEMELILPAGACAADLLERLQLPAEEAGLIAVNNCAISRQTPLSEGDRVTVYPMAIGG